MTPISPAPISATTGTQPAATPVTSTVPRPAGRFAGLLDQALSAVLATQPGSAAEMAAPGLAASPADASVMSLSGPPDSTAAVPDPTTQTVPADGLLAMRVDPSADPQPATPPGRAPPPAGAKPRVAHKSAEALSTPPSPLPESSQPPAASFAPSNPPPPPNPLGSQPVPAAPELIAAPPLVRTAASLQQSAPRLADDQTTAAAPDPASLPDILPPALADQAHTPPILFRPAAERPQPASPATTLREPAPRSDMSIVMTLHTIAPDAGGPQRLTLKLTPHELGSVSFDIKTQPEGGRSVAILFERPETMALFQRDQQHLETALQRAGLSADPAQITFALASPPPSSSPPPDQGGGNGLPTGTADSDGGRTGRGTPAPTAIRDDDTALSPLDLSPLPPYRLALRTGLDILA